VKGSLQQVTPVSTGNSWYYYPSWAGDTKQIVVHHVTRLPGWSVQSRIEGYALANLNPISYQDLGAVISIAYAMNGKKIFAAWTAAGLQVYKTPQEGNVIVPISWCRNRQFSPGTIAWDKSGEQIFFAVYDKDKRQSELYSINVTSKQVNMITSFDGYRVTNISVRM
jgi:hypothetical protein